MRRITAMVLIGLCGRATGQTYLLENFEGGSNLAAWTFASGSQTIETSGGYFSNSYLRSPALVTGLPVVATGNTSTAFTGNYRTARVGQIGATVMVNASEQPVSDRRPALMLISFNGTPADPSDDWAVYTQTATTVGPLATWFMHNFTIPASQTTLPANWFTLRLGPNAPANPDWNTVIQAVDRVAFTIGDPTVSYPPFSWDIGVDYLFVATRYGCYPNCDGSTESRYLNVLDFLCFLNKFAAGDPYANCDYSTTPPVLNVLDFACFLMQMAAGCTGP